MSSEGGEGWCRWFAVLLAAARAVCTPEGMHHWWSSTRGSLTSSVRHHLLIFGVHPLYAMQLATVAAPQHCVRVRASTSRRGRRSQARKQQQFWAAREFWEAKNYAYRKMLLNTALTDFFWGGITKLGTSPKLPPPRLRTWATSYLEMFCIVLKTDISQQ